MRVAGAPMRWENAVPSAKVSWNSEQLIPASTRDGVAVGQIEK